MTAVVDDVAVVQTGVKAISEIGASGDGKGVGRGTARVRQVACVGVAGIECELLAAAAGDLDGTAVVVALGGVADALNDAPARIGAVVGNQRPIPGDAGACRRRSGIGVVVAV